MPADANARYTLTPAAADPHYNCIVYTASTAKLTSGHVYTVSSCFRCPEGGAPPPKKKIFFDNTLCSKKGSHQSFGNDFLKSFTAKKGRKFPTKLPDIFHYTLSMFPHYLGKVEWFKFIANYSRKIKASFFGTQCIYSLRKVLATNARYKIGKK